MKEVEILLVEDDPHHAELTLMALREGNLGSVHLAPDGEEALRFLFSGDLSERKLKLILLDLKLIKLDGLELLRRIRSDPRTRHLPIVVLTSSLNERDIGASYDYGANSYIVKPLEFEKFISVVSQLGTYWVRLNQPPVVVGEASDG